MKRNQEKKSNNKGAGIFVGGLAFVVLIQLLMNNTIPQAQFQQFAGTRKLVGILLLIPLGIAAMAFIRLLTGGLEKLFAGEDDVIEIDPIGDEDDYDFQAYAPTDIVRINNPYSGFKAQRFLEGVEDAQLGRPVDMNLLNSPGSDIYLQGYQTALMVITSGKQVTIGNEKRTIKTEHTQYALGNSATATVAQTEKPKKKRSLLRVLFNIFAIFCIIVVCTPKILGLLANLIAILTGSPYTY